MGHDSGTKRIDTCTGDEEDDVDDREERGERAGLDGHFGNIRIRRDYPR